MRETEATRAMRKAGRPEGRRTPEGARRDEPRVRRRARGGAVALTAALALVSAWLPARADDDAQPRTWYAETVSEGEGGFVVTHYWSRGSRLRAETVFRGHRIVTIVNGERYYVIDALLGRGVGIQRSAEAVKEDGERVRPFATEYEMILERGGEKLGEQVVNGRLTEVYRATDGKGKSTVWVTADEPRYPIRVEHYSRISKETAATSYVNWLVDLPIPQSFFEPPQEAKIEYVDYEDYLRRSRSEPVGPAPVLYSHLLHGSRD